MSSAVISSLQQRTSSIQVMDEEAENTCNKCGLQEFCCFQFLKALYHVPSVKYMTSYTQILHKI